MTSAMPRPAQRLEPGRERGRPSRASVVPVRKRRSAPSSVAGRRDRLPRELGRAVGRRAAGARATSARSRSTWRRKQNGAAAPDADGLERGGAAQERLVVGVEHGLGRIDERRGRRPRPRAANHAATRRRARRAAAAPSPTTPRSRPRARSPRRSRRRPRGGRGPRPPRTSGSSARARSRRSGRSTPSAPIDAPRPTGSSAAIRSTAAIFGAPVTEPPGKVAARISAERRRRRELGPRRSRRGA